MQINSQLPVSSQQPQIKKQAGDFPAEAFFGKDKVDINFSQVKAEDYGPGLALGCAAEGCKESL